MGYPNANNVSNVIPVTGASIQMIRSVLDEIMREHIFDDPCASRGGL